MRTQRYAAICSARNGAQRDQVGSTSVAWLGGILRGVNADDSPNEPGLRACMSGAA